MGMTKVVTLASISMILYLGRLSRSTSAISIINIFLYIESTSSNAWH